MKRIALISLFVFVMTISVVYAGNSTDVSFEEFDTQGVYLYENDEVRFDLMGGQHVVIVEDVGKSSIKIDIGAFIGNSNYSKMMPGLVGLDYIDRVDLDKDGIADLNIALYSIDEDGRVMLVLQDLTEVDSSDEITGNVGLVDSGVVAKDYKNYILVGIGIIVLGLVIFLIFRTNVQKDDQPKEENKVEPPA
jgi:hypothetical protein